MGLLVSAVLLISGASHLPALSAHPPQGLASVVAFSSPEKMEQDRGKPIQFVSVWLRIQEWGFSSVLQISCSAFVAHEMLGKISGSDGLALTCSSRLLFRALLKAVTRLYGSPPALATIESQSPDQAYMCKGSCE